MTTQPRMTTAAARDFVARIEALHEQISAIEAEIVQGYSDGAGSLSVIMNTVTARQSERDERSTAEALLGSFDAPGLD